ncbi:MULTISPECIES: hypothetical protein [unclassified Bradyrhizobium]
MEINPRSPYNRYAILVDGRVKTEFATRDGVEGGAKDLKRRFPMLQIKIYDAQTKADREIDAF